ncbi:COX15/CtaA family protein [Permianibacter sp. IMCC34836]|uniref:COX15/CtaA family protein n=1 Tax=Permianibacter fluminis TaxID=2738515 RepID=UPI0015576332|nr:COX15/CtaA family protein [Permianibacter fluminis]NQD36918.1 COX15/CtaA family protein [Permianibacter fluminis]
MNATKYTRWLATFAALLAVVVVGLGAWTRLSDAGLGCPDWPTCYGHLSVPDESHELQRAAELFPEQTVVAAKAWPEMIHRYFAATLGLCIIIIAALALRARKQGHPLVLPLFLAALVCVQGAFGAWTVTMKLMPVVVTTHLLLGFTTLSLLTLLALQLHGKITPLHTTRNLQRHLLLAAILVVLQIFLGGWTSSNYAAVVCNELPVCQGDWLAQADFAEGFSLHLSDRNYEFGVLSPAARIAIHSAHRLGAWLVLLVVGLLALRLWRSGADGRRYGSLIGGLLLLQIGLGISNVVFGLPLAVAVAHNGVGALLLISVLLTNLAASPARGQA